MAQQLIGLPRPLAPHRIRPRGIGPHIGAALLFGHGHAECGAGFLADLNIARVVLGGEDFGQPHPGNVRLQAQGRHAGEGHGQRAATAGFSLGVQVGHARAGHMGTGLRVGPGQGGQAVFNRRAHQLVVRRVKLHQIDPMTITVMADKLRFVFIG